MKDFLKIYRIQIMIGTYVAVVFAFFYFVAMPMVADMRGKADEIQQKKIDGELNEKRLADVPVMEENYAKFEDNEDSLTLVIEPNSEVGLIKELEALAEQTNNRIEFKIQDTPETAKTAAKKKGAEEDIKDKLAYTKYLSMQIAIEGNYADLLNFIHKLENYEKTVNILSVSSEKKELDYADSSSPFAVADEKKAPSKEVVNSILDVVVYIKK